MSEKTEKLSEIVNGHNYAIFHASGFGYIIHGKECVQAACLDTPTEIGYLLSQLKQMSANNRRPRPFYVNQEETDPNIRNDCAEIDGLENVVRSKIRGISPDEIGQIESAYKESEGYRKTGFVSTPKILAAAKMLIKGSPYGF